MREPGLRDSPATWDDRLQPRCRSSSTPDVAWVRCRWPILMQCSSWPRARHEAHSGCREPARRIDRSTLLAVSGCMARCMRRACTVAQAAWPQLHAGLEEVATASYSSVCWGSRSSTATSSACRRQHEPGYASGAQRRGARALAPPNLHHSREKCVTPKAAFFYRGAWMHHLHARGIASDLRAAQCNAVARLSV